MTVLDSCPFCARPAVLTSWQDRHLLRRLLAWLAGYPLRRRHFVHCAHCDIVGPPRNSPEEAAAAWDARPEMARLRAIETAARAYEVAYDRATYEGGDCTAGQEALWAALEET